MDRENINELLATEILSEDWGTKRNKITDSLPVQATKCSWCSKNIGPSAFTAFSLDGTASICSDCLGRYAILSRLAKLHAIVKKPKESQQEHWIALEEGISNEIAPNLRDLDQRKEVVAIVSKLAHRAAAIINGAKTKGDMVDSHSGISLSPIRIHVSSWTEAHVAAFKRGLEFIGMPMVSCLKEEISNGFAKFRLDNETMRDDMLFEYGVLFVRDGYISCDLDCSAIFLREE